MNHNSVHSSVLVHISSMPNGYPENGQEYSTWTTNLQNTIGIHEVQKIVPIMVSLPNIFDNITSANNTLYVNITGQPTRTITVPPGFYETADLLTTVQTLIRVHQADVTVTQNATSRLVEVTSPTNTLTILSLGTLAPVLGFLGRDYATGETTATSVTAPITPNVNTAPQILLHCNHAENNSIHSDGKRSHVLAVLEFSNTQRGATKTFTAEDLHQWEVVLNSHRDLNSWTFQLTDHMLNPVFLPGNCAVEVFMKLISTTNA